MSRKKISSRIYLWLISLVLIAGATFIANSVSAKTGATPSQGMSLWSIIASGGISMLFLGAVSVAAVASILYHFR